MEPATTESARARAEAAHLKNVGDPQLLVRAPGRVNLIGEHTDYNDGFCLPMALPFDTVVAASSIDQDHLVRISSEGFGAVEIRVNDPGHELVGWAKHIAGVLWHLQADGIAGGGWAGTIASDIPAAAGLSSSAAVQVATCLMVLERNGLTWSPIEIAKLVQRVESEVVGVRTGIMDQYISAGATLGHAGLLDCQSLTLTPVPMAEGVSIAVLDTGTRRTLVSGEYDNRRASCELAAKLLGVPSLRSASLEDLVRLPADDPTLRARARHVVSENARTLAAVQAMRDNDAERLGQLMNESHLSLRDDFEVSSVALDKIVEVAKSGPGCFGARMTGGGFGGCAVALVGAESVDAFRQHVLAAHDDSVSVWICEPHGGAGVVAQ